MTSQSAHCLLLPSSFQCQCGRGGLRFLRGSLTTGSRSAVGKGPYAEAAFRLLDDLDLDKLFQHLALENSGRG